VTLDVAGIVAAVESHAEQLGVFERVITSEPKSAPGNGLSAAIWASLIGPVPAASGLDVVTVRLELMVRILKPMLSQPYGQIDPDILAASDGLMGAYCGSFTLGGEVRDVDLFGAHGPGLSGRAGYITIDKTMFRVMDITLPLIINDLWTEAP
jgi:hypothetical protein